MARCRVSFIGSDGTVHLVKVDVDSLYEAIGLAVAEFRSDKLTETPGPMTEFTVAIERPPVETPNPVHPGHEMGRANCS